MHLLKNFVKNIGYLFSRSLKKEIKSTLYIENLIEEKIIENFGIEMSANIKDVFSTIDALLSSNKSIIRFGDGEIQLIKGNNIPFQKASAQLSKRLKEVLSSDNENILIALPRFIYTTKKNLNEIPKTFWSENGKSFRDQVNKHISTSQVYYAAEFTIAFEAYKEFDKELYFKKVKLIWHNKNITIICGKTVFSNIDNNIFDNAKNIEYQYVASSNAFEDYNNIFHNAMKINKERLIILILGPTAKILAYDLALSGFRALDLGHIAKSYDWYKKNKNTLTMEDVIDFFNPD